MRNYFELSEGWRLTSPCETLKEALISPAQPVSVPHTWNATDGANGTKYLRAKRWYLLDLPSLELNPGEVCWVEFLAASLTAEVYLNGQFLAEHRGGFSAFHVDLTPVLGKKNLLAVAVDNRKQDGIYPQDADFTFYGGLYREVRLVVLPAVHFAMGYYGACGLKVTPIIQGHSAEVAVEAFVEGASTGHSVTFTLADQTQIVLVEGGKAAACFHLENPHLWDGIRDPYLYTAIAQLDSGDEVKARFGCRSFAVDPDKGFILNGHPYPLRGVARHQDRLGVGNALTPAMQREDMEIIAEMGANTIRLAHYPHHPYFYDLCDEYGMVVWAEIPYISRHISSGRQNTLDQMQELVVQNYNHPSIVCWGLSNEITMLSDIDEELMENHQALHQLCHQLDSTRLTTMAHVNSCPMDSPIQRVTDLRSYNIYFGWYLGQFSDNGAFLDRFHKLNPDLCVGLSEYGADANPSYQSAAPERGDYSETYQALYHEKLLQTIEARPWLWATHLWNMFDFGVAARNEGGTPGQNQKGLVTMDRLIRKDAYYLYRAYWSDQPFVHLCGRRYVERTEAVTQVKVYSNQPEVTLYVNGVKYKTLAATRIFCFELPLEGEVELSAPAGECSDSITIRRVSEPNKTYKLENSGGVVNWFDQESFKANFCSIKDPTTSLLDNPATHDRTVAFCEKMAPGFVYDKKMLQAFGGLPLEGMIRRNLVNLEPEEIKEFQAFLQRTPKADS